MWDHMVVAIPHGQPAAAVAQLSSEAGVIGRRLGLECLDDLHRRRRRLICRPGVARVEPVQVACIEPVQVACIAPVQAARLAPAR